MGRRYSLIILFAFCSPLGQNVIMNADTALLSAAVGLVSNAVSTARNAVELAKTSGNHDLKNAVSDVLNDVLDLKLKVAELGDQNREYRELNKSLETKLKERASVKRKPEFGYYYQDGDPDPLCPKCYEGESRRLSHLSGLVFINPYMGRECCQCGWVSSEYRKQPGDLISVTEPSHYTLSRGYGS